MRRLSRAASFGFFIGTLGVLLTFLPFVHQIEEHSGLALLFTLRGPRPVPSNVVIVSIDKEAAEYLALSGNPARWNRSIHARLVEKLVAGGADLIIFDMYFIEPRSFTEDTDFAAALRRASNVILAEPLRAREISAGIVNPAVQPAHRLVTIIKPVDALAEAALATAPFVLPRLPVRVNHYWTFQPDTGDSPTFPAVAFQIYASDAYTEFRRMLESVSPDRATKLPTDLVKHGVVKFIKMTRQVFEADREIYQRMLSEQARLSSREAAPTQQKRVKSLIELYGGSAKFYLNYYGPPRTINTVPLHRVLRFREDPRPDDPIDLRGKAVFVGMSETLISEGTDSFYTVFAEAKGVFLSGVEIAATAFANLLDNDYIKPVGPRDHLATIFVWGVLVGVICRLTNTVIAGFCLVVSSVFFLLAVEQQFQAAGIWYPVMVPLFVQSPVAFFTSVLWNLVETNRERRNIRKAFGYYVPPDMVDPIVKNRIDLRQGGQSLYGVCLFTDISGYTLVSEKLSPREVSHLMHRYFEAVFEPIVQNGGMITNLKGDSILAIWKTSDPEIQACRQACSAALGIADAVRRFEQSSGSKLPTRVGIHAGEIFLGNIGAREHYEYGPTGDTVNTASRLDTLNKMLGTEILFSETAFPGVDGLVARKVGKFRLRGKLQPLIVYELLCRADELTQEQGRAWMVFSDALEAFDRGSWHEAEERFLHFSRIRGEDALSRFYIKQCRQHRKVPPTDWDGAISIEGHPGTMEQQGSVRMKLVEP